MVTHPTGPNIDRHIERPSSTTLTGSHYVTHGNDHPNHSVPCPSTATAPHEQCQPHFMLLTHFQAPTLTPCRALDTCYIQPTTPIDDANNHSSTTPTMFDTTNLPFRPPHRAPEFNHLERITPVTTMATTNLITAHHVPA
ncbi:hypothetical protein K443DRAFT_15529 [Laccaria amethystina LaAM-08-1]|uniref:Uncharacterized protein n=1 Tax=Laccaria amethystina LaAM-08-1 TaxID=1095629 RepID=A0A0C9WXI7_9AGAR|nr:hypothetical protein K443DRAFT_15529 [Laccaria amethystina LaAM-08-1]